MGNCDSQSLAEEMKGFDMNYSRTCRAEPAEVKFDLRHTAVIIIDMQVRSKE